MSKHRLFYSTKCRHCQAFLEELSRTPFVPEFQLICVDPSPNRPALPGWLKSVPSMLVAGESTPRVGPGPVNNWLFERKLGGGGGVAARSNVMEDRNTPLTPPVYSPDTAPRPTSNARGSIPSRSALPPPMSGAAPSSSAQGPAPMGGDGPEAYHGSEMGSSKLSDNYSFLGMEFTSDKGYNPISRNFESLIGPGGATSGSKAPAAPQSRSSAKADALNREFEAFTASRDSDMPQARGRM